MNTIKLNPVNGAKSFYGKAVSIEKDGNKYLKSYKTIVCGIIDGQLVRFWDNYSATTQNHINAFLAYYGIQGINKKQWEALPVNSSFVIPYEVKNVSMKYKTNYNELYCNFWFWRG